MKPVVEATRTAWTREGASQGVRAIPEETAVAIVHDASTAAVMMATPADLEDFAIGFSLTEGIIEQLADIRSLDIVPGEQGVEARLWLAESARVGAVARQRRIIGPTGCGLCGVDSLAEAAKAPRSVAGVDRTVSPEQLLAAMQELEAAQTLGRDTRAVHAAAAWFGPGNMIVREDVGRHNALDKLVGACARAGRDGRNCILLLTSRVSVEMVQKAAVLGAPIICAISAPTALAVRTAEAAGMTLAAIARHDGFEVFVRSDRVRMAG